ncbi:hypothetical protein POKO110462_02190 [Pontibacter korlensis]|uniref:Uncharacterized protein n=1 Tax=Pontibacter korlensis TaxID=400092 RepID=A0A0E3ZEJ5_9BACT|nr:hypothetical protein [Pontibacter korlensis]AKD03713.1 hypothetical protein PKOR_11975 [Pontibacter korlensis]
MQKKYCLSLLLAVSVLLFSCHKDDNGPQTDYAIESDSDFELISQHPNGWIKEARTNTNLSFGSWITEEFEYFENGYIKSAKLYRISPSYHLYMEVRRNEDNKPLWSKYYTPEGGVWFETEYANGLVSVKKVHSKEGTAIHRYTNGELNSVEFTASDNSSTATTTYNANAGTRNVTVTSKGETVLEEDYPYQEQVGAGFYTNTNVPAANPFDQAETVYRDKNWGESFLSTGNWEPEADPLKELMLPYRLPGAFYENGRGFATKLAVSSNLYQSIIEQYPVTENGILLAGGYDLEGFDEFSPTFIVSDSLAKVKEGNPDLFELKYGQEIVAKVNYGKTFIVVGAVRNLPTNNKAAEKIKEIAKKRLGELRGNTITVMNANKIDLLPGENFSLTSQERELLNKVWFEVKFFSNLKEHRNGLVIDSAEEYYKAIGAVNDADPEVINLKYRLINSY